MSSFRNILQTMLESESKDLSHLIKPQVLVMSNGYINALEKMVKALIDKYIHRAFLFGQFRMQRLQEASGKKILPIILKVDDFDKAWESLLQDAYE